MWVAVVNCKVKSFMGEDQKNDDTDSHWILNHWKGSKKRYLSDFLIDVSSFNKLYDSICPSLPSNLEGGK